MKVLHGTWIPNQTNEYIESGSFYLWVETPITKKTRTQQQLHPGHLSSDELINFLVQILGIKEPAPQLKQRISTKYFALPTANHQPLPSPELIKYLEFEISEDYEQFQYWDITCYETVVSSKIGKSINIIKLLKDIHFLALYNPNEFQIGSDLLFWYHYTQVFRQIILKDQYIPALKYRAIATTTNKKKGKQQSPQAFEIYATWEIISEQYETNIQKYIDYMPLICVAGSHTQGEQIDFFEPETLLRHFSESILHNLVTHTPSTATFDKQIADSLVYYCLNPQNYNPLKTDTAFAEYQQWLAWQNRIQRSQADLSFHLCFQLHSPTSEQIDNWQIQFLVSSKQDPSLKLGLSDYWTMNQKSKTGVHKQFGQNFETNLLLNLGYAARMYPKLWQGLETDCPTQMRLTLDEAFDFLKESAWILEDSGFKVIVPAWYTPAGRRRAKIRLKASTRKLAPTKGESKSYFGLDSLVQYQYELAIGDAAVTPKEWEQLVNAKAPLVHFRGQWMELDREKMQQLL